MHACTTPPGGVVHREYIGSVDKIDCVEGSRQTPLCCPPMDFVNKANTIQIQSRPPHATDCSYLLRDEIESTLSAATRMTQP